MEDGFDHVLLFFFVSHISKYIYIMSDFIPKLIDVSIDWHVTKHKSYLGSYGQFRNFKNIFELN